MHDLVLFSILYDPEMTIWYRIWDGDRYLVIANDRTWSIKAFNLSAGWYQNNSDESTVCSYDE